MWPPMKNGSAPKAANTIHPRAATANPSRGPAVARYLRKPKTAAIPKPMVMPMDHNSDPTAPYSP